MPREVNDHKINPANDRLQVEVLDDPGPGGAYHLFQITGFNSETNPSDPWFSKYGKAASHSLVLFQNGPIEEDGNGVNGVTHEVLIAIILHRLRSFQDGTYACRENALAITKLEEALHWLHHRTLARMRRGVEGTHKV